MISDFLGMAGGAIILGSFLLDEADLWDKKDLSYNVANALGSLLLTAYAWAISGYPFLVINAIWSAASAARSVSIARRRVSGKFGRKKRQLPGMFKCL